PATGTGPADPHLPGLGGPPASTATDVATAALFETGPVGGPPAPAASETAPAASETAPASNPPAAVPAAAGTPSTGPRRPVREAEPIDLLDTAGMPVLKRLAPGLVVLAILVWLLRRLRS
ncbi:MAG: hypothetical protein JWN57_676, partial [Frankiales bacterium]|nr:hypothetical protein [Frankiales bacterium]